MATANTTTPSNPDATTDMEEAWRAAVQRYEQNTLKKITILPSATSVDDIMNTVKGQQTLFSNHRHDKSKFDKLRTLLTKVMNRIDLVCDLVAQPSVNTANSVSADYDKIADFFEELNIYLSRLKVFEKEKFHIPELKSALTDALTSVLDICGICTKYLHTNRIVKFSRSLFSGGDKELTSAFARFHKAVEHEGNIVRDATLVVVNRVQQESDQNNRVLVEKTKNIEDLLQNKEARQEHDKMLNALSEQSFHTKQRDTFSKHSEGTGQWMVESNEFQQWFQGSQNSVLWCYGIPGGGKTVFTSIAVNYVSDSTRGSKSGLVYLYIDYKDPKTHSGLRLLASICRQLAEQIYPTPSAVRDFLEKNAERKRDPTEDEWVALIDSLCLLFQRTYVIVDALDECPENNRDKFLNSIKKLEKSIRFLFTSRPHIDIAVQFTNFARLEIAASESDIETYLESEIKESNRLCKFVAKDNSLKERIIERVKSNATGMFLLAQLQMNTLRDQNSLAKVRVAMTTLPPDVDKTYHAAMTRINNQSSEDCELARRALSYIFIAKRPLYVEELIHALGVEVGNSELDPTLFPEQEILLSVSAGLIRIDEKSGIIGLVHHTLDEYFKKFLENLLPDPDSQLAQTCLTYLSFEIFDNGPCRDEEALQQRLHEYRLLEYASHHWGHHMENQLPEQVDLALEFFEESSRLESSVQILYATQYRTKDWFDRFPRQFGSLHVAAYWGLERVMSVLVDRGLNIHERDSYGATPLLVAVMHGHMGVIVLLLDKGADVNTQNHRGESALYWAARKSYKAIFSLLLARGAELYRDEENWTALNWIVINGDVELANALLSSSVNLDAGGDGRNETLFLAAEEGQSVLVQLILDSGADVNAKDWVGSTALDFAATLGHEAAVKVILDNGANVHSRDNYDHCALHWSVQHDAVFRLLVEKGANFHARNDSGQSVLCWCAQEGSLEVAELILDRNAAVNVEDNTGITPLHRAALRGHKPMIELLLKHGADPDKMDKDGWTPLHCSFVMGHQNCVELLENKVHNGKAILESLAIEFQDVDKKAVLTKLAGDKSQGNTALTGLRFAAQEGQVGRIRTMLEKGAEVDARDAGGYTALELAIFQQHREAALVLLEHGANANKPCSDEKSPLSQAINGNSETMVELLLDYGADSNASSDGLSMLHLAADIGNISIVQLLIDSGADIHALDASKQAPLHVAAVNGREEIARLLIEKGANVNDPDERGRTPLMLAMENLQHNVVTVLLSSGASVKEKNRKGQTALDIATMLEDQDMIQLLSSSGDMNADTSLVKAASTAVSLPDVSEGIPFRIKELERAV